MSTISEQGDDAALQKRIRQAVYDIRYKARKEEIDLRHAYSVYIGKSGLDQNGKEAVQNKLFGKKEEPVESIVFETAGDNKYKVRATNKETGKTYVRFAKRGKINKLRSKGSVEITGHGIPKGSKTSSTSQVKKAKGSKSLANLSSNLRTANKYEPTKITARSTPPKPKKMKKETTKEDFIADAAAVAPIKNKKIGGEKVDNSKLIKVYPNDESDPQIGNIKSSYKPVGEVVAEILAKESASAEAGTGKYYVQGKPTEQQKKNAASRAEIRKLTNQGKHKEASALHAKITKTQREEFVKEEGLVDPFYKSVPEEGDDGTGRSMYAQWNNVKNRLRSMGLKMNYELEGNELIEDAVEYFYEQGITEETIDLIVEEVGLDDFVEFVLDPHQDLVEARAARKASASAPSYEKVKAKVDAGDAARKAAGKGEYAKTAAAKRNYGDEEAPEGKPVAKKKAKPVASPAKKAATKKKVTAAVKKVKPTAPEKTPTKKDGVKDGLRAKITGAVKKGFERHQKAVNKAKGEVKKIAKTASDTAKQHSQHRKDLVSSLKATPKEKKIAGGIGKAVKKAVTGEEVELEGNVVTGEGYQRDPDQQEKERKTSKQTDPSKPGFTGISDSIEEIMRQNAAMKKKAAKKGVKEHHEKDADGNVIPHKTAPLTEGALVRQLLEGKG